MSKLYKLIDLIPRQNPEIWFAKHGLKIPKFDDGKKIITYTKFDSPNIPLYKTDFNPIPHIQSNNFKPNNQVESKEEMKQKSQLFDDVNSDSWKAAQDEIYKYNREWNNDEVNQFVNTFSNHAFNINDILKLVGSESHFDPSIKAPGSSARGLFQITKDTALQYFGDNVWNQYLDGTRSISQQLQDGKVILDDINRKIISERDKMTYGRLKVNMLAPNKSLDSIISDVTWLNGSLSKHIKPKLTQGKSTYRDLMNLYDSGHTN